VQVAISTTSWRVLFHYASKIGVLGQRIPFWKWIHSGQLLRGWKPQFNSALEAFEDELRSAEIHSKISQIIHMEDRTLEEATYTAHLSAVDEARVMALRLQLGRNDNYEERITPRQEALVCFDSQPLLLLQLLREIRQQAQLTKATSGRRDCHHTTRNKQPKRAMRSRAEPDFLMTRGATLSLD
jgi:hypothetical protein